MDSSHPIIARRPAILTAGLALLLLGGIGLASPGPSVAQTAGPPATPGKAGPTRPIRHPAAPAAHTRERGGIRGSFQPAQITQDGWTNAYPQLASVSAVAANDVWAVGEAGHLLHYADNTWTVFDPPALLGADVQNIAMFAANNGWIAAEDRAFAWDGTAWTEHSAGLGQVAFLNAVGLSSANQVWGIGNLPSRDSIMQWNGSTWVTAGPLLSSTIYLSGLAFNAGGEGWADGVDTATTPSRPVLLHYSGGTWATVPVPADLDAKEFTHLDSPSAGEVWMNGPNAVDAQYIYSYRAGTWGWKPVPANPDIKTIHMESATHGWLATIGGVYEWDGNTWQLRYAGAYWGVTSVAGLAWAVGAADTVATNGGAVLNSWSIQRQGATQQSLYAVAAVSPREAWAGGEHGTMLHYTGGTWVPVAASTTQYINRIQALSADDVWAVGYGVILHWDSSAWSTVYTTTKSIASLAMTSTGTGWAVGENGAIWRCTDGTWTSVPSPTTNNLWAIAMDSPNHGWAAGSGGVMLEWNGTNWTLRADITPTDFDPYGLALAPGGGEGWLVGYNGGNSGTAIHLLNGTWTADTTQINFLGAVAVDPTGTFWATGDNGLTQRYTGNGWQGVAMPARLTAWNLAFAADGTGWAVGYFGEIDHYLPPAPACNSTFSDVQPADYFAVPVQYLACRGIVGGYADGTFRPYNDTTRAQVVKIVAGAFAVPTYTPASATFADVAAGSTFYPFVEAAVHAGIVSGYPCGGAGEPCNGSRQPYFRPGVNVSRGQLAKIVVLAAGWTPYGPSADLTGGYTFADVQPGSAFFPYVETVVCHGVVSGYPCGGAGEGCDAAHRPYYRPANLAKRGQISKIVYGGLNSVACMP